jgi:uncharacterized protein (TIGR03067 family)
MRKQLLFLLALAVLALGFAPAPFPKRERVKDDESRKIQGTWVQVQQGFRGRGMMIVQSKLVITTDRMIYNAQTTNPYPYALTIDAKKQPMSYDIKGVVGGPTAGRNFQGIYKLEGDTLTLCYTGAGQPRPTTFDGPGRTGITEVYQRQKR